MDLFTQYSPENYRTYLNEFIGSHGLEDYNNSDLDGTVFYNGGQDIRLVWENTDGIVHILFSGIFMKSSKLPGMLSANQRKDLIIWI